MTHILHKRTVRPIFGSVGAPDHRKEYAPQQTNNELPPGAGWLVGALLPTPKRDVRLKFCKMSLLEIFLAQFTTVNVENLRSTILLNIYGTQKSFTTVLSQFRVI